MKIGILGCRGIPNHYGGFEQFAEHLSEGLVELGVEVWVYNSHHHPYKETTWKGVNIIRCKDPEDRIGSAGQIVYDLNCILDSRKRDFDIILQLGYVTCSLWYKLLPRKAKIITNMDGLEWQRKKYNGAVKWFITLTEKLAVKSSDLLIADSEIVRNYLIQNHAIRTEYIPYGADVFTAPDAEGLETFKVLPQQYFLVIARLQADNHIEEIIRGVLKSGSDLPLLIIGNINNKHGNYLKKKYKTPQIQFLGSIFWKETLNQLRYFSRLYFHGHSAGGTNPSLLEAMAASAPVCAHDNPFNHSVLGKDAFFFKDENQVADIINKVPVRNEVEFSRMRNIEKIRTHYVWDNIISAYYKVFVNERGVIYNVDPGLPDIPVEKKPTESLLGLQKTI